MNINDIVQKIADRAVEASRKLIQLDTEQKNKILRAMADALDNERSIITLANQKDCEAAKKNNISDALLDRLRLTDLQINEMVKGIHQVIALKDPIGEVLLNTLKDNGLHIKKCRVPIGVIGVIYESRPNVTADVSALCLKTGNALILRGGADAKYSNQAILEVLLRAGKAAGLPEYAIQNIPTTDREAVRALVQQEGKVDLVIPRGGGSLIKTVIELAKVPIIKHYKGLCHIYVDETADIEKALNIVENAKCQRSGVCNSVETLLIHKNFAQQFLPKLVDRIGDRVEIRGGIASRDILPELKQANDDDWDTEYLDLILSVKVVEDIDQAINHINIHGSHHSDAILSEDKNAQDKFLKNVDSAAVYVNASTRFTDGSVFGMGVEIGISTDKLHARGPMGLEELTTYKYCVIGDGQIRN